MHSDLVHSCNPVCFHVTLFMAAPAGTRQNSLIKEFCKRQFFAGESK